MTVSPLFPYAFVLLLVIPFLAMARRYANEFLSLKKEELKILSKKDLPENHILAYERMTIFLERVKPANLVQKFDATLKPHEFLFLTEKSISEEFDYNAAQQLYISENMWQKIVSVKNNILQQLRKTYAATTENATLEDFKTLFLMKYMDGDDEISRLINDLRTEKDLTIKKI